MRGDITRAKTYSYQDFRADYPNSDACLAKIMELRYGRTQTCGECKRETKYHRIAKRRGYACQFCGAHVYPCVGTPFEKSTTPLNKWFFAMYLFTTTRHGVAARELERQLGVTYKCAWRMAHEIRSLMARTDAGALFGDIEADETYIGGRRIGKRGRGAEGKTVVVGIKQRQGPVKSRVVGNAKRRTIEPIIREHVRQGSTVNTDEWWAYRRLGLRGFRHQMVRHGSGQWVADAAHTNNLEGYWSQLKRSIRGTHVSVSSKHLQKYLGEFDFRHNARSMPNQMFHLLTEMLRPDQFPA